MPRLICARSVVVILYWSVSLQAQERTLPSYGEHSVAPEVAVAEPALAAPQGEFLLPAPGQAIAGVPHVAPAGGPCNCPECQKRAEELAAKQEALAEAVDDAYGNPFYFNNFDYIEDPLYQDWFLGDRFKRMPIGQFGKLDIGGQYRIRFQDEQNFRGSGLTGRDDDFLLHRTRIFMNGELGERTRAYVEFIDSESNHEEFTPRGNELNRADIVNLFLDYKLFDGEIGSLTSRIGRQEFAYGSQRLIGAPDWSNARRSFEAAKFMWQSEDWKVDAFFAEPVTIDPYRFDNASDEQEFFGGWGTYKGIEDQTIDLYALQYNKATGANNFEYTTIGSRWTGSRESLLWDFEGGVQFGENSDSTAHSAGFATAGLGHKWNHDWKPKLWFYYDWASGSDSTGQGKGFNYLFPAAHAYLGYMDLYARSNIESPNVQFCFHPTDKLKVMLWYYYFFLENKHDTPYNTSMAAYNPGNEPRSADLGHELDLIFCYDITPRTNVVFGYSHFFAGQYYKLTPGVQYRDDADFFYMQYHWNF